MIPRDYPDIVFTHLPGQMGENKVSVLIIKFDSEHGVGKGFPDNPFNFYRFFVSHSISYPPMLPVRFGVVNVPKFFVPILTKFPTCGNVRGINLNFPGEINKNNTNTPENNL
jgi:hypothetical protein